MCTQGRVSDAHLRGEAACAQLQDKLDVSGAALQTATANHKELEKQKRAVDKKLVRYPDRLQHIVHERLDYPDRLEHIAHDRSTATRTGDAGSSACC